MPPTDQPTFDGDDFDPTALLWSPGVDYVRGWRNATDAAAELLDAIQAAGIETSVITARADATPEGMGVLRLVLPTSTARQLAMLARAATARIQQAD